MIEHESGEHAAISRPERSEALASELQDIVAHRADPEVDPKPSQGPYGELQSFLSESARQKLAEKVMNELADPDVRRVTELEAEKSQLWEKLDKGEIDSAAFDAEDSRMRDELYGPLREATLKYTQLSLQQEALGKGKVELYGEMANDEARRTISMATNADVANQAHMFIKPDRLRSYEYIAADDGRVLGMKITEPIEVPLGMFVSAESFETWKGRRPGVLKDGKVSADVIDAYAEKTTLPPPVELITGYALPDGRIYFKSDNSHRVAAAIKRGDRHIEVKGRMTVYLLDTIPKDF